MEVLTCQDGIEKNVITEGHCPPEPCDSKGKHAVEGHLNPGLFNPGPFNPGLFNHEFLGLKSSWLKSPGLKCPLTF